MKSVSVAAAILCAVAGLSAQVPPVERSTPRIETLQAWLSAAAEHRPGALDDAVHRVNALNQEQLHLVWTDVSTLVSMVREPSVNLFYINEPVRATGQASRQVNPLANARSRQVLYTLGELKHLRAQALKISPELRPGPENEILRRGAMLHADIAILSPRARARGDSSRPGPGGVMLFMDDGQQTALHDVVSHWNMGRRLLDMVRPPNSTRGVKTTPDPGGDETVRRWYVASLAYMLRIRQIEATHFDRALDLFSEDPYILFFAGSAREVSAGARTQSVMRAMDADRRATFDVQSEGAELRRAEQLYKRALERNPQLTEARIRLGRVLGRRGRHEEAVKELRQGQSATEPLLQFYAHLFLGAELEALGNLPEARRSYEQAAAIYPAAQSPLFGLSRVADLAGDGEAARAAVERILMLPGDLQERADPWWVYEFVQARNVDRLLEHLRQRF